MDADRTSLQLLDWRTGRLYMQLIVKRLVESGKTLKLIRTEYDAYNRRFKLLDTGDAAKLQDGKTYLLVDSSSEDLEQDSECTRRSETNLVITLS
jgi:hypothetical protein